jgi:3-deoxy-D-manno-octulosonic-acid transferase
MMRLLYNLLFPLLLLATLPSYLLRMWRRGGYRADFSQRFGRYAPSLREQFTRGEWIWLHAVSVGELMVGLKLLEELHRRHPSWRFVVSSTTSTAHAIAVSRARDWWIPVYTPVDFAPIVRRALDTVRPRAVVLVESEMWPNFVWNCADREIPVALVNARISPRSARRYAKFATVARTVVRHLTAVGLQEPEHAALWEKMGVAPARLQLTGSVKFDPSREAAGGARDFRPLLQSWGFGAGDPILLGGSTHAGEEEILAKALLLLRKQHQDARLLIAPRHVERTPDVVARLAASGLRVSLRRDEPSGPPPDILIINTTGELRDWYACADAVFIGKSLAGLGGQNPVEAIVAGRPVLFGPHMENFAALRDGLLNAGGAIEVSDAATLADEVGKLFTDSRRREEVARRAGGALEPHQGATSRTADLVERTMTEG